MIPSDLYPYFIAAAIVVGIFPAHQILRNAQWKISKELDFFSITFILGITGAKIFAALGSYLSPIGLWDWNGGSIVGFMIFTVPYWLWWARKNGASAEKILVLWSWLLPLSLAIGRMGCFFAGCCYGFTCHGPLCAHLAAATYSMLPRFPWPPIEAACLLIISFIFFLIRKRLTPERAFTLSVVFWALNRFFLEFLRGDEIRGHIGPLSLPQVALCVFIVWLVINERE